MSDSDRNSPIIDFGNIRDFAEGALSNADKALGRAIGRFNSVVSAVDGVLSAETALNIGQEAFGIIGGTIGAIAGAVLGIFGGRFGATGKSIFGGIGVASGSEKGYELGKELFNHIVEVINFNKEFPIDPLDNHEISDYLNRDISRMYSGEYTTILNARADLNQPNSGRNSGTSSDSESNGNAENARADLNQPNSGPNSGTSSDSDGDSSDTSSSDPDLSQPNSGPNYGSSSDSDSSESGSSDPDVGQSIGLDAFGGAGEDVGEGGGGGGDPGGGDPGGGFGGKPIVLDLDGDGLELVALEESTAFYDIDGDGYREQVAWASADDGFLAYDKDGDGIISAHDELSFVSYVEDAQTDLEGLAHFDTNNNGELDPGDTEWSKFRVWQDLDQDGESDPGELRTLTEAGITSISLTSDGVERTEAGNTIFGEGSYAHAGGSRSLFDVALQHSRFGFGEGVRRTIGRLDSRRAPVLSRRVRRRGRSGRRPPAPPSDFRGGFPDRATGLGRSSSAG